MQASVQRGASVNEYRYKLDGIRPVPQGRAKFRVFKHGKGFIVGKPYYGKTSKAYREQLLEAIKAGGIPPEPLSRVMIYLEARGMRKNADPDNLAKQVLDALVTAGVIVDDNCTVIRRLIVDCFSLQKKEAPGLTITVAVLSP
jgi:Holliday junction resolvase RusA-like endonuclease